MKHKAWSQEHRVSEEQLQSMINLLGTHDDHEKYEKALVQLLDNAENPDRTRGGRNLRLLSDPIGTISQWIGVGAPRSTSNNAHKPELRYKDLKLPRVDDAAFLADLCVLRDEHPAYADIAGEIIQAATESLGKKLKRASKDIARCAEREIGLLLQEISGSFGEQRLDAEKRSKLALRDLIQRALDEEPSHPSDSYVFLTCRIDQPCPNIV